MIKKGILSAATITGYESHTEMLDSAAINKFHHALEEVIRDLAVEYHGEFVKRAGGVVLVFFPNRDFFLDFAGALNELSQKRMLDFGDFSCDLYITAHYGIFSSDDFNENQLPAMLSIPEPLDDSHAHEVVVTEPLLDLLEVPLKSRGITTSPTPSPSLYKLSFPALPSGVLSSSS